MKWINLFTVIDIDVDDKYFTLSNFKQVYAARKKKHRKGTETFQVNNLPRPSVVKESAEVLCLVFVVFGADPYENMYR